MSNIVNIRIDHIHPHPDNPRKNLGDLTELVESIKKNGVMQNLTVIPAELVDPDATIEMEGSHYTVLIGHRRLAAAKLASLKALPCRVIESISQREQVSTMLEENMQRNDLTIYEQAQGFQMMMDLGETEESIAEKTGFSKTTIRHRLNIAKLDQKELKKKEQDDSFQMTLRDLYELEKVEDIKTRNKILKEAKDSREIVSMAQRAVAEALRNKRFKKIAEMAKKAGIEKAPKEAENEMWSGKWDTVKDFDLDKEPPKKISVMDDDKLYYLQYYRSVRIIRKHKNEKKVLTPTEIAQKEKDNKKKQIKAIIKETDASRKEFIQNIIEGKMAAPENEDEIREKIWRFLLERCAYLSFVNMVGFFTDKEYYNCSMEEQAEAKKKLEGLSYTHSMLLALHNAAKCTELVDYKGCYKKDTGETLKQCYDVLKAYGWTFASEDAEKVLDGTHELYEKETGKNG